MKVELVYDQDCPNTAGARANLLRAFAEAGLPAKWQEWERASADTPEHARQFGSPAVLVNRKDVAGMNPNPASACRLYQTIDGGSQGFPSAEIIHGALIEGSREGRMKQALALAPAIGMALLPKAACPACWPAYLGLLSAVGLGFLAQSTYLLPLTAVFLGILLFSLAYRARARRGYTPFFLGLISAAAVLLGKFAVESNLVFYPGLALLVGASIWNTWPRKASKTASCCKGTPAREQVTRGSA